jgi:integrase/recombinase XerD
LVQHYLEEIIPDTLRHTFATRLYNVSQSQVLVSNQLGHSSTKPTELYTHIVSAEAKDALRKL